LNPIGGLLLGLFRFVGLVVHRLHHLRLIEKEVQLVVLDIPLGRGHISQRIFRIQTLRGDLEVFLGCFFYKVSQVLCKSYRTLYAPGRWLIWTGVLKGYKIFASKADNIGVSLGDELKLRNKAFCYGPIFFFIRLIYKSFFPVVAGQANRDAFFFPGGVEDVVGSEVRGSFELDKNALGFLGQRGRKGYQTA